MGASTRFGKRLRALIVERGLTPKEVARLSELSANYIRVLTSQTEKEREPSLKAAQRIAAALGVSVEELIADDAEARRHREVREAKEAYEAGLAAQERIGRIVEGAAHLTGEGTLTASGELDVQKIPGAFMPGADADFRARMWTKLNRARQARPADDALWRDLEDLLEGAIERRDREG